MGKCCLHTSSFIFYRIIIRVAGNQDRQERSDEFDFRTDQTTHFGVTCPWMTKILHFGIWISLRPVGQSWSNFMCSITEVGWLDQNSGVHGNKKPPLTYNGENGVSTFSRLLLIQSFLARLYVSTGRAIAVTTASASVSALAALLKMLKFLVKVFKGLYLLNPLMDLVGTLPDVRYWSEVLCCTITTHIGDFEVKVTDFKLKFLVEVFRTISSEALAGSCWYFAWC